MGAASSAALRNGRRELFVREQTLQVRAPSVLAPAAQREWSWNILSRVVKRRSCHLSAIVALDVSQELCVVAPE